MLLVADFNKLVGVCISNLFYFFKIKVKRKIKNVFSFELNCVFSNIIEVGPIIFQVPSQPIKLPLRTLQTLD